MCPGSRGAGTSGPAPPGTGRGSPGSAAPRGLALPCAAPPLPAVLPGSGRATAPYLEFYFILTLPKLPDS